MTSEIRTNILKSRAGMSTVTMTDTGPMFSGITTFVDNSGFTFGVGGGTSIFTPATNVLTFGTNNTEKIRIDANGNANITGVTTAANFKTGVSNLHDVGLTLSGGQLDVGNNIKAGNAGVITATAFHGDGSNLTGITAGTSLSGSTNNTVCTVTGANAIQGEANLTFDGDNLTITGSNHVTQILKAGGATSDLHIDFKDSSNNLEARIFCASDQGDLRFYTGGANERLRITSGGKVSIGNLTSPDSLLHIHNGSAGSIAASSAANLTIESDGSYNVLQFLSPHTAEQQIRFGDNSDNGKGYIAYNHGSDYFAIGVGGPERLRIASDGNMGLGTNSLVGNAANVYLTVNGSTLGGIALKANGTTQGYLQGTSSLIRLSSDGAKPITFDTNGSERLRITSSGQLLMGETSAVDSNTAVQFTKNVSGNQARFIFRNNANNGNSRVQLQCMTLNRSANADTFSGIEKYQSGGMAIYNGENTNQYATMSFFNNGWASLRLRNGNHSGYDVAHISGYWGTSNGLMIEQGGPQSGTFKAIRFTTSHYGGERGYIGVTLGGTSYNSSSDYRQKQDIVDLTGAIDRVKSLKPRRFKWKDDPTYTVDGFLAHEAQTVVPESVVGEKDAVDENGDAEYQVIDQSKLVPVLAASIQELIAKVETLEQENVVLRARVTNLEGN